MAGERLMPKSPPSASTVMSDAVLDAALDAALHRALTPPALPAQFNRRLQAALTRARASPGLEETQLRFERERRELLQQLQAGYVQVRQRTLVTMIAGAFVAGAVSVAALPWLVSQFGTLGPVILTTAGAIAGLVIGFAAW